MQKVVITGSASLEDKVKHWVNVFSKNNFKILAYPVPLSKETFLKKYPDIHKNFYKSITKAEILFVMNEEKKGIKGYIGAETFAEIAFATMENLLKGRNIEIVLLNKPSKEVQSVEEINLWLKLGWITFVENSSLKDIVNYKS
jgi:hypothetical protein